MESFRGALQLVGVEHLCQVSAAGKGDTFLSGRIVGLVLECVVQEQFEDVRKKVKV